MTRASGTDLPRLHLPTRNGWLSQHFARACANSRTVRPTRTGAFQRCPLTRLPVEAAQRRSTRWLNGALQHFVRKRKIAIVIRRERYRPSAPPPRLLAAGRNSGASSYSAAGFAPQGQATVLAAVLRRASAVIQVSVSVSVAVCVCVCVCVIIIIIIIIIMMPLLSDHDTPDTPPIPQTHLPGGGRLHSTWRCAHSKTCSPRGLVFLSNSILMRSHSYHTNRQLYGAPLRLQGKQITTI